MYLKRLRGLDRERRGEHDGAYRKAFTRVLLLMLLPEKV